MDPCSVADSLQISTSPTTSEEDGSTDSNRGAQATTNPYRYAKMCDLTAMSVSHGRLHISRQSTLRVLPGATQHSRAVTGPARRYPHGRGAFALASWVVRRCRRAVRSTVQTAVGRASRWRSVRRAPIDCGPSRVGGRRMGNRNGARLVSPEWDEGVWFRSADVAHISLSSAVR